MIISYCSHYLIDVWCFKNFSSLSHWQNVKTALIYEWLKKFHSKIYFEILLAWPTKWCLTRFSIVSVSWRSKIISDYRDIFPGGRFCHDCKRVCLTFVFLSALSSTMKWRRGRRKSGKTREKTTCLPSFWVHHSLQHDFTPMENLSFSMTRPIWRFYIHFWPWLWYIPYKFWLRLRYMTRFFSRQKLIDFNQLLYSIPKSFRNSLFRNFKELYKQKK